MEINTLEDLEFQRYARIKRKTYDTMLEIVIEAHRIARTRGRMKSKFIVAQMLLIIIEDWKNNCTYFSLGIKDEIYLFKDKKSLCNRKPILEKRKSIQ